MTAPSFPFIELADSETERQMPFPSSLLVALRNSAYHLRDVVLDPDIHTAAVAHDHDGVNSGLLKLPSPNMLPHAAFNTSVAGSSESEWFFSKSVSFGTYSGSDGGAKLQNAGEYITTEVGSGDRSDVDDLASEEAFGAGATICVSLYARTTAAITTGAILFGLGSGSIKQAEADGTGPYRVTTTSFDSSLFPGCAGLIHHTDLSTSWKRFWFRCNPGNSKDGVFFIAQVADGFDKSIRLDCPAATCGPHLGWFAPMPNDKTIRALRYQTAGIPIYDETVSITSAVRVPAQ